MLQDNVDKCGADPIQRQSPRRVVTAYDDFVCHVNQKDTEAPAQIKFGQVENERDQIINKFQIACSERDEALYKVQELKDKNAEVQEREHESAMLVQELLWRHANGGQMGLPGNVQQAQQTTEQQRKEHQFNGDLSQLVVDVLLAAPTAPAAAMTTFQCCLQCRDLQPDRTDIFERIVQVICQKVERGQADNNCLGYWLVYVLALMYIIETHGGDAESGVDGAARDATFCSRSGGSSPSDSHGGNVDGFAKCMQVAARHRAVLFKRRAAFCKHRLAGIVHNIVRMIHGNVCNEIAPLLLYRTIEPAARPGAGSAQPQAPHKPWTDLLHALDDLLGLLRANNVPKVLLKALLKQLFRFIDAQLFIQLLGRRERSSFSFGKYLVTGLEQVAHWIHGLGADYDIDGYLWVELEHLRQAAAFLVADDKPHKSLEELTSDLCPDLSIRHLYILSTGYSDDKYKAAAKVSPNVLSQMKKAVEEPDRAPVNGCLLVDYDPGLPTKAADLLAIMDAKDLYGGIKVPQVPDDGDGAARFAAFLNKLRPAAPSAQ